MSQKNNPESQAILGHERAFAIEGNTILVLNALQAYSVFPTQLSDASSGTLSCHREDYVTH